VWQRRLLVISFSQSPLWDSSTGKQSARNRRRIRPSTRRRRAAGDDQRASLISFSSPSSSYYSTVDTAFKQQRLKAWQPILTPKTVLPTLFIIGILFAPIGGLLLWGSSLVSEITLDYTECENLQPSPSNALDFQPIPSSKYKYNLRSSDAKKPVKTPTYAFLDNTNNGSVVDPSDKKQCIIEFEVPADIPPTVFFYYKLSNFFQNHRRYVKSFNSDQLKGKGVSNSSLEDGDCKPLATLGGKAIYPCGLIANSLFNGASDHFATLRRRADNFRRHLHEPLPNEPPRRRRH
jgi:hypothetical protein